MKHFRSLVVITGLSVALFLGVTGCEKKEPPPEATVVKQKITPPAPPPEAPPDVPPESIPAGEDPVLSAEASPEATEAAAEAGETVSQAAPEPPAGEAPPALAAGPEPEATAEGGDGSEAPATGEAAAGQAEPAASPPAEPSEADGVARPLASLVYLKEVERLETAALYDPTGRIDPFEPLFKEKPEIKEVKARTKRIPTTPLEKIDLSQLRLTAIFQVPDGNRALVEEATGKGYVIQKGTYIGLNSGVVAEITDDRVVVEEESENYLGKISITKRELRLPKLPGEE